MDTKRKRREGSPPRGPSDATPLHIRVTGEERAAIKKAADRDGLTVSGFVRRAALVAARRSP